MPTTAKPSAAKPSTNKDSRNASRTESRAGRPSPTRAKAASRRASTSARSSAPEPHGDNALSDNTLSGTALGDDTLGHDTLGDASREREISAPPVTVSAPPSAAATEATPTQLSRIYRRGVLSAEDTLLRRLSFDLCDDLDVIASAQELLRNVVEHRYGGLISGAQGTGKSCGVTEAVRLFRATEARCAHREEGYKQRDVVILPAVNAASRSELIRALYSDYFEVIKPNARAGGDERLLHELIEAWRELGVVAVAFDEVQRLEVAALDVVRDIMVYSAKAAAEDETAADKRGLGVIMIATPEGADRVRSHPEYGQRWIKDVSVLPLEHEQLAATYAQFLPCCAGEAARRGDTAWMEFLTQRIAPNIKGSIRRVEYHVREYITLCVDNLEPRPREQSDIPFDESLFVDALTGLAGSSPFTA